MRYSIHVIITIVHFYALINLIVALILWLSQFVVQTSSHLSHNEKTLLLVLALKWRKEGNLYGIEEEREAEKQIWLSHISALTAESAEVSNN